MKQIAKSKIWDAIGKAGFDGIGYDFSIEEPPKREMGDWATNVALVIFSKIAAAETFKSPREVAQKLKESLETDEEVEKVEIAGPGFLNITFMKELYLREIRKILDQGKNYGKTEKNDGKKINVEYVSANPTGPLHVGNARSGPIGEAIANLLEFTGAEVEREFYINDIGIQIGRFGRSLYFWYKKKSNPDAEFPEGGYPGEYIELTSKKIQETKEKLIESLSTDEQKIDFFIEEGLKLMIENIKDDLSLVGIKMDRWTKESEILASSKSRSVVHELTEKGFTREKDGAIWFQRPDDPSLLDKESVLVKSDKEKSLTYFANDIAYHLEKLERNDELVDVWGANHFGHIPRMKAALSAFGYSPEKLYILLYQYVRLKKSGQAVSMGKRLGNFVTLRQVIESGVHPDAFKYFILAQNANTPMDFDIELASDTSERNPVFYIKYAHARISSILRKAGEGIELKTADLDKLEDKREIALLKELATFTDLIDEVSFDFQIQAIPHFAYKIASLFHNFYDNCKVIGSEKEIEKARLALVYATKCIIARSLLLCGIEAPEKM